MQSGSFEDVLSGLDAMQKQAEAAQHVDHSAQLIGQGRYAEAERELRKAIEINPMNATAHGNMGGVFLRQGRPEEAIPWLEKALELNPHLEGVPQALAQARAMARDELPAFSAGAILIFGPQSQKVATALAAQFAAEHITGALIVVRDRADEFCLPSVKMSRYKLIFGHYRPPLQNDYPAWAEKLIGSLSFGSNPLENPETTYVHSTDSDDATLILTWNGEVDSSLCVRAARDLERTYLQNGGHYSLFTQESKEPDN